MSQNIDKFKMVCYNIVGDNYDKRNSSISWLK